MKHQSHLSLLFRLFPIGVHQVWQVISNFAFSLVECAPAALLAGLLKTESLFDLESSIKSR